MKRTAGAQAIGRATEILRVVARIQRSGATLAKVGQATGLNRSTAFRILRSLSEEGLLEFEPERRRYAIGPLAYELGLAARGQADLIAKWQAQLEQLSQRTGLTAYLVARSDSDVVCLSMVDGASVIRAVPLMPGQRLPLGVGAGSLSILASLPDAEVDFITATNAPKLTAHGDGRLTPAVLIKRVAATREDGYAFSQSSVAAGVLGVGVSVSPPGDLKQLALSVSKPAAELGKDERARLAATIRDVAESRREHSAVH